MINIKLTIFWDDALTIQSDSQFFDALKAFLTATLSVNRAGELLASEAPRDDLLDPVLQPLGGIPPFAVSAWPVLAVVGRVRGMLRVG